MLETLAERPLVTSSVEGALLDLVPRLDAVVAGQDIAANLDAVLRVVCAASGCTDEADVLTATAERLVQAFEAATPPTIALFGAVGVARDMIVCGMRAAGSIAQALAVPREAWSAELSANYVCWQDTVALLGLEIEHAIRWARLIVNTRAAGSIAQGAVGATRH